MTSVPKLTEADFATALRASEETGTPLLVDFMADWCAPCRELAPELAEFAGDHLDDLTVVSVDVDQAEDVAARYAVAGIPALLLFAHGRLVLRTSLPRTRQALHDSIDPVAALAERAPAVAPVPSAEPTPARVLKYPTEEVTGLKLMLRPPAGGDKQLIETLDEPLHLPPGWQVTVVLGKTEDGGAAGPEALAGFADDDIDRLRVVSGKFTPDDFRLLTRFRGLSCLEIRSKEAGDTAGMAGKLAGLPALREFSIIRFESPVTTEEMDRVWRIRPDLIMNGEWVAPELRPALPDRKAS
ncbi:thioredoxin family protein [Amycolatopsis pigmentata]|uniref:Thioredoxin family protein n=1 Tax=Amycolatopsis pigmentata TaxID=450801 RepID=A0ABW5G2B7_9PSEU